MLRYWVLRIVTQSDLVQGIDNLNACYGGTAALLNAIYWMQSKSWDGRYALVVAADIAVYEPGPARPSGGCGAVVMLVGPNAPLVFEDGLQGSYFEHVYDFYKPHGKSEYPVVAGQLSIECYLRAIDNAYDIYRRNYLRVHGTSFSLDDADFAVFHSPFNKLVQKSLARLYYNDFLTAPDAPVFSEAQEFKALPRESTYGHREINNLFAKLAAPVYKKKTQPSVLLPQELGNCYCASLWAGLVSLLANKHQELVGKRVLMFSYGSGLSSTMFSFKVTQSVSAIAENSNVIQRLESRMWIKPKKFAKALLLNEKRYQEQGYNPKQSLGDLFPGTFYLERIDEKMQRKYHRLPNTNHSFAKL